MGLRIWGLLSGRWLAPIGRWGSVVTVGGADLPGARLTALGTDRDAVDDQVPLAFVAGGVDHARLLDEGLTSRDRPLGAGASVGLVERGGALRHVDDDGAAVRMPPAGAAWANGQLEDLHLGVVRGAELGG